MKDHKKTFKHIEIQKQRFGETECTICKVKYPQGYWKEHKKTRTHILIAQQKQEINKIVRTRRGSETEVYTLRPGSEENQQYINTLTTLLAVRLVLNDNRDFKISINNDKWNNFGDIVFEFVGAEVEIEAIRCKKIETTNNYTTVALSAESGKLSLKEQCEILQKLRRKDSYEKTNFKLYTVSSVLIEQHPKFTYDEETVQNWDESGDRDLWKGVEVEIKQSKSKKRDLFNTTDDADDVCTFQVLNNEGASVNENLKKFQMYINQKKRTELMLFIKMIIKDKFSIDFDISEKFVKYIRRKFKTDKVLKRNERSLKLTREDVLLKITELLLEPFHVISDHIIGEKSLDLWNATIKEFDITVLKHEEDILRKIYQGLNHVLKAETQYSLSIFNEVKIDTNNIANERLKMKLFDYDGSLKFLYLSLWKSGLTPLVLRAKEHKDLDLICDVVNLLKEENILLKFIVTTSLKPVYSYFPEHLRVFSNMSDLKLLERDLLERVLAEKVKVFNCQLSLKEIDDHNSDFLRKLSPDALLNILLKDFSFISVQVPMTKDIVDNVIVLNNSVIKCMKKYLRKSEGSAEKELTYFISVNEQPTDIQVPPQL